MAVANVTAQQRHWDILVKHKADWLALTEIKVRQREIPVMRSQLIKSCSVSGENRGERKRLRRSEFSVASHRDCCSGFRRQLS